MKNPNMKSIFIVRKPSIIRKNKNSELSGGLRCWLTRLDTGFRFCRSKNNLVVSFPSVKFSLSRNIRIDNSDCHAITVTVKRLKTSTTKFLQFFCINVLYFDGKKLKSDIHLRRPRPETFYNPERLIFPDYREYQIRGQGFLEAGFVHAACNRNYRAAQSFALSQEKLITPPPLIAAGGNNTFRIYQ